MEEGGGGGGGGGGTGSTLPFYMNPNFYFYFSLLQKLINRER